MTAAPTGVAGDRVAMLRKARNLTQAALAGRARVSVSLLSKIELGERALTPSTAGALAQALHMTLGEFYGEAEVPEGLDMLVEGLRTAVRRYDIPDQVQLPDKPRLRADVDRAAALGGQADLAGLLELLPGLVTRATTYVYARDDADGWALLADAYASVYYLAARHRWMDLLEVAPARQEWAAGQRPNPLLAAHAARSRAGTFLNTGDFDGGLAVVDRAIVSAESSLTGPERAFGVGVLHLRGMTLAGRCGDRGLAARHISAAWRAAEELGDDARRHGEIFGPANTATHVLATEGDLGQPNEVVRLAEHLAGTAANLPPTRQVDVWTNTARAQLDLGDRDHAEESLTKAWAAAPQKASVHPMSLEVLRVLISLHRRGNPRLTMLAHQAGLPL